MRLVALVVAFIIGFLFSAAHADEDDEPPDSVLVCPTHQPRCDMEDLYESPK